MSTITTGAYIVGTVNANGAGVDAMYGLCTDNSYVWLSDGIGTAIKQINKKLLTYTTISTGTNVHGMYTDGTTLYIGSYNDLALKTYNPITDGLTPKTYTATCGYSTLIDSTWTWLLNSSRLYRYTNPLLTTTPLSTSSVLFGTQTARMVMTTDYIWVLKVVGTPSNATVYRVKKTDLSTSTLTVGRSNNAMSGMYVDSSYIWVTNVESVSSISQIPITDGTLSVLNTISLQYITPRDAIYTDGIYVYVTVSSGGSANFLYVLKIGSTSGETTISYALSNLNYLSQTIISVIGDLNYIWCSTKNDYLFQLNVYGLKNVIMLDNSGSVWVVGFNRNGQLGIGNTTAINTLLVKPTLNITGNVIGFGGGMNTAYILSDDGTMYASGLNIGGSMLNLSATDSNTFIQCTSLSSLLQGGEKIIKAITNGVDNTYYAFLTSSGNVYSMGVGNGGNQFGNSTVVTAPAITNTGTFYQMTNSPGKTPVDIQVMLNNIANMKSLFVLMSDGTLFGCGYSAFLGIGVTSGNTLTLTQLFGSSYTFPNLTVGETISQISASSSHVLALTTLGNIYTISTLLTSSSSGFSAASGVGSYSTTIPQWVKVNTSAASAKFSAGVVIKRVIAGNQYSVVLFADGSLWGCGVNSNGQLGTGNYTSPITTFSACLSFPSGPTKYASAVQCLNSNTIVLASDGTVYACGFNDYGQLGQNNMTYTNSLVQMNATGNTPITNIKTLNINYVPIIPGVVPSAPIITSIYSTDGSNQTIVFTQTAAIPAISGYSYSVNGGSLVLTTYTSSPFTINSAPGTSVSISGNNAVGTSVASNSITVGTPPIITGITLGFTSISVTFTAGTSGNPAFSSKQSAISGYKVSTDNGVTFQTCNTSPITVTGLTAGNNYKVLIQSYDPSSSLWYSYNTSNVQSITTYNTGSAPSNLSLSRIFNSETTMILSFTDSSGGVPQLSKYQYSLNSGAFQDASGTSSPIIISNLSAGTSYSVVIKAVSGTAWTSPSSTASASVITPRIGTAPSSLVLSPISGSETSLKLSFTGSTNGVPSLTGYKYSKTGNSNDYTDVTVIDGSFVIQSLTPNTQYTIYLKVVSGNDWESGVSSATASTYRLGSIPYITGIDSSTNAIIVNFAQDTLSVPSSTYYYSYLANGSNRVAVTLLTPTSFAISTTEPRTVYVIADSSAGTLISVGSLGIPSVAGNKPIITNITPGLNKFTVGFSATGGNPPPTYYYSYSASGSPLYGPVTSGFDTNTNLSNAIPYTIYVVSSNSTGNVVSDGSSATPLVIGNAPTINSVSPGFKSLTINFSNSTNANPAPNYYYSYDLGQTFYNSTYTTNTPILIPNLTDSSYTIQLKGVSEIGNTAVSTYTGAVPYLLGSNPTVSLTNGRGKITVNSYSQATPGTYTTNWFYYLNDVSYSVTASSFDISGSKLTDTSTYSFYMLARNPAGDVSSNLETGSVFGSDPTFSVVNGAGKITVQYLQDISGNSPTKWYYYLNDASNAVPANTNNTFDISGSQLTGTNPYSIYMVVSNPAGDLSTNIVRGNVLGSGPTATLIPGKNQIIVNYTQTVLGTIGTTYSYYLNGVQNSISQNPFTIPNLFNTSPYSLYILANNPAGDISSNAYTGYVLGSDPSFSITNGEGKITVNSYYQTTPGTNNTSWFYYLNDVSYSTTTTPFDISGTKLTGRSPYSFYMLARNPAGDISSNIATGNVVGSVPTITGITPGIRKLTVNFQQSITGTATTTYYYSYFANGSSRQGPVTLPSFDILNIDTAKTVYIIASNPANDNLISTSGVTETPYVVGSIPNISSVSPIYGSETTLRVYFATSTDGVPGVQKYQYSLNGGGFLDASGLSSPFIITDLSAGTSYAIKLKAVSPNLEWSSVMSSAYSAVKTYKIGTKPSGLTANAVNDSETSLLLSFTGTSGGDPAITKYQYSLDNGTTYKDASGVASPITITDLSAGTSYSIKLKAVSENAWDSVSDGSATAITNKIGTAPTNLSAVGVDGTENSLRVSFTDSSGGYPTTSGYKYSTNGTDYFDATSITNGSFIIAGLTAGLPYTVRLKAYSGTAWMSAVATASSATTNRIGTAPSALSVTTVNGSQTTMNVSFVGSSLGVPDLKKYQYSLDHGSTFVDASGTTSPLTITGLTPGNTYSVILRALSGLAWTSQPSTESTSVQIYKFGSIPNISSVSPVYGTESSLTVSFADSSGGYPNVQKYQYSLNDGSFNDALETASPITLTGLTGGTSYAIKLKAVSGSAWSVTSSASSSVSTYKKGSAPVIGAVTPGINQLSVAFSQATTGTSSTTFYYSTDGTTIIEPGTTTSPLVISGISTATTFYLIARNPGGDIRSSSSASGAAYLVGTSPAITDLTVGINTMTVYFGASAGGNPAPKYYYVLDNSTNLVYIGTDVSYAVINNLSGGISHSVSIVARGLDASNVEQWRRDSGTSSGTPYNAGTKPQINSISPSLDSLTFDFNVSTGGYPSTPTYYYLLDGSSTLNNITSTPVTIPNLSAGTHTLSVVAKGFDASNIERWSITADASSGAPYKTGNTPSINSITGGIGSMSVNFNPSIGGNPAPTYYYSLDYGDLVLIGKDVSNVNVPNLTPGSHTVSITAKGLDGNLNTVWTTLSTDSSGVSYADPVVMSYAIPAGNTTIGFNVTTLDSSAKIDWGDSSSSSLPLGIVDVLSSATHTYSAAGTYTVRIIGNNITAFQCTPGQTYLRTVTSFGNVGIIKLDSAFSGVTGFTNVNSIPTTLPTTVTRLSNCFNGSNMNDPNIVGWDVSRVTSMTNLFASDASFNQPIGSWNVMSVQSFQSIFYGTSFNQPIGGWNTVGAINMRSMFQNNPAFNQDISGWNTASATTMSGIFYQATAFNQPIGSWNTGSVTDMTTMFKSATSFNQDISGWNTGSVTNMTGMFQQATLFNSSIGGWNVGKVTTMQNMFYLASSFNQPIGGWNTENVTNMAGMFQQATSFNRPIGGWNVGKVTTMQYMFYNGLTTPPYMAFNQSLANWNTGSVTTMESMFWNAYNFNQPLTYWNTINVTTMKNMFHGAIIFNQPINTFTENGVTYWNTSNVTDMQGMFGSAFLFDQHIGNWDVSNVKNMQSMFSGASGSTMAFNKPIGTWNVSKVTNMDLVFFRSSSFNQPIGSWDTSSVTTMSSMFLYASKFNQPLTSWNTGLVTTMTNMFNSASEFNQSLGSWNVSSVTDMTGMFTYANTMSVVNFDNTLNGWVTNLSALKPNVVLSTIKYSSYGLSAYNSLKNTKNWVITVFAIAGTTPVIGTIVPGINKLTVNFTQSVIGTATTKYYYSTDGVTKGGYTYSSPFVISGLSGEHTFYVIASNPAGDLVSAPATATPYYINTPVLSPLVPGLNKLTVTFSTVNANPAPTYYYSYSNTGLPRYGPVTSPFDISNISVTKTVYIVASNTAGNLVSSGQTDTPYLIGITPVIKTVTPAINSLIVDFSGSTGGFPTPSYFYSVDGGAYVDAKTTVSPITITKLTTVKVYTITIIARNLGGDTPASNAVGETPIVENDVLPITPTTFFVNSSFFAKTIFFKKSSFWFKSKKK